MQQVAAELRVVSEKNSKEIHEMTYFYVDTVFRVKIGRVIFLLRRLFSVYPEWFWSQMVPIRLRKRVSDVVMSLVELVKN